MPTDLPAVLFFGVMHYRNEKEKKIVECDGKENMLRNPPLKSYSQFPRIKQLLGSARGYNLNSFPQGFQACCEGFSWQKHPTFALGGISGVVL